MIHIGEPVKCANALMERRLREALEDLRTLPRDTITLLFREDGAMEYDDGNAPDHSWADNVDPLTCRTNPIHAAAVHDAAEQAVQVHYALGKHLEETSAILVTASGCAFFPDAAPLLYWVSSKRDGKSWPDLELDNCFPIHCSDTSGHEAISLMQMLVDLFRPKPHPAP